MHTSLVQDERDLIENIKAAAESELASRVVTYDRLKGGRNSRVYWIECSNRQQFAVKIYFRHSQDKRDRLNNEFSAMQFLWNQGLRCIPQPIAINDSVGCAFYEFVRGKKISSEGTKDQDIESCVRFLSELKRLARFKESQKFSLASEACFSVDAIVQNIQSRLDRFNLSSNSDETYQKLIAFLRNDFKPLFKEVVDWCQRQSALSSLPYNTDIALRERTLSPSDFGFHNAIKREDGPIIFLDFEYFGWDDPAKTVSDFLLHPAMDLPEASKRYFAREMFRSFAEIKQLKQRVEIVYPLFGLKWAVIFLNEFIPVDLSRRGFATSNLSDEKRIQGEQLIKSQRMLNKIKETFQHFNYHE